jgi:hypothetical protein
MTKREIFTQVYLSLLPKMTTEIKAVLAESDNMDQAHDLAVDYSDIARAITFGWEMGMDFYNDLDLKYHAVGSGSEQTSSTADLYQAYPKQAAEAEVPPVAGGPEDV